MSPTYAHRSLTHMGHVAIALCPGSVGQHVGVFYRLEASDQPKVLHLAWHHTLISETPGSEWAFMPTDIDTDILEVLAGFCDLVFSNVANKGTVPYAFEFGDSGIDDAGAVFVGGSSVGLTCATFVLALFRHARVELLDVNSWRQRDADIAAQQKLVRFLERAGVDRSHVAAVCKQVGCMRYRAEEVAVASVSGPRPVSFERAESMGRDFEMYLTKDTSH